MGFLAIFKQTTGSRTVNYDSPRLGLFSLHSGGSLFTEQATSGKLLNVILANYGQMLVTGLNLKPQ